jgi:hypothetical protein
MTDTIESLRARIAEVERSHDKDRADAARLAEALRAHETCENAAAALAAHDAGTPTGGVWLTEEGYGVLVEELDGMQGIDDHSDGVFDRLREVLRKARGGG